MSQKKSPPSSPRAVRPRTILMRGLRRRCPLCGAPGTFASWFEQRDRCPTCQYPTVRVPDQWIGAYGMNIIVSFTVIVGAIAVGFAATYPNPPVVTLTAMCGAVALVFPLMFQPISRSLWSAIDLAMRAATPEDGVDPRYLPSDFHRAPRSAGEGAEK